MWRVPCMNINTKFPHAPIMHHTNGNEYIMGMSILWKKTQYASNERDKLIPPPEDRKYIQKEVRIFFHDEIAVNPTMILSLCTLEASQSKIIEDTKQSVFQLND